MNVLGRETNEQPVQVAQRQHREENHGKFHRPNALINLVHRAGERRIEGRYTVIGVVPK